VEDIHLINYNSDSIKIKDLLCYQHFFHQKINDINKLDLRHSFLRGFLACFGFFFAKINEERTKLD
jgi:hypothetical protein